MFVLPMKTTRPRVLAFCGVIGLLLVTVGVLAGRQSAAASATVRVSEESQRRSYLTGLGYELEAQPGQVQEVLIPAEFDDSFSAYNALQQQEGMDLSPYRGKRVKCWTYTITNYPGETAGASVLAHLYIYRDTVIGGDISSTAQDGFRHGLRPLAPTDDGNRKGNDTQNGENGKTG